MCCPHSQKFLLWIIIILFGLLTPANFPTHANGMGQISGSGGKGVGAAAPNGGNPIFRTAPSYSAGTRAMTVAVGDFNGDGRPDLVVPNLISDNGDGGQISILFANADGSYQSPVSYPSGPDQAWSVVVDDFNKDGRPDVAVSGKGDLISILLGNGGGSLQAPVSYAAGYYVPLVDEEDLYAGGSRSLAIGDLNNDRIPDIAFTNGFGGAGVLLGTGKGAFSSPLLFAAGQGYAYQIAIGDLNRDGKADLALANQCVDQTCLSGSAVILLGNGDGTFQPLRSYASGAQNAVAIAVGDLNGDAIPDLAIANTGTSTQPYPGTMSVLLGKGDGSFGSAAVYASGGNGLTKPAAISIADFDQQGKPDVALLHYCAQCDGMLSIFRASGDGTFRALPRMYAVDGWNSMGLAIADLNRDSKSDVAIASVWGGVNIFLGNGDATLLGTPSFSTGGIPVSGVVGNFNGDGNDDLAVANQCIPWGCQSGSLAVLLGNGNGTFQLPHHYFAGKDQMQAVAAADFNRDGKLDLAFSGYGETPEIGVMLGNGKGAFELRYSYQTSRASESLAIADFNLDGKPDLAIAPGIAAGAASAIFLGNGDGTLQAPVDHGSGNSIEVAAGDLNGDGKPDLIVADPLQVMLGNGNGSFQSGVEYPSNSQVRALLVRDLNADGKADVAAAAGATTDVLFGVGDGRLLPPVAYPVGGTLAAADFDGDGIIDLAAGSQLPTLLHGTGAGAFEVASSYSFGGDLVGDFNRDGKPDLSGVNLSSGMVTVLLNVAKDFHYQSSTSLSSSHNPANFGETVTFTATVTPVFPGNVTGTVTFSDSEHALATEPVLAGKTTFTVSSLAVGDHTMRASYSGDSRYLPSSSKRLAQAVVQVDTTPPVITVTADPKILWPPNKSMVPVKVSGRITDLGSGLAAGRVEYAVTDEYGIIQQRGRVILNSAGYFSFTTLLRASRVAGDKDGRHYRISVSAADKAGNRAEKWALVEVPGSQH